MCSRRCLLAAIVGSVLVGMSGGVTDTASAQQDLSEPRVDLLVESVHVNGDGELIVTIANGGPAATPPGVDGVLSVFVDGRHQSDFTFGDVGAHTTQDINTGVHLTGRFRRIFVFADATNVFGDEWTESNNMASMTIDLFWRHGYDLAVDAEIDEGTNDLSILLENRGDEECPQGVEVHFEVFVGETQICTHDETLAAPLGPGDGIPIDPACPAIALGAEVRVTMSFTPSGLDGDTTDDTVVVKHVLLADVDPEVVGTPYYELLTNNPDLRAAILWRPYCEDPYDPGTCPDSVPYDDWPSVGEDPDGLRATFRALLLRLEQGRLLPSVAPPPELWSSTYGWQLSEQEAVQLYLGYLARVLWFDVRGGDIHGINDPEWSLSELSPELLELLPLNSSYVMWSTPGAAEPTFWSRQCGDPQSLYDLMSAAGMIRSTKEDTVWAFIDYFRGRGYHDSPTEPVGILTVVRYFYPLSSYPGSGVPVWGGCGMASWIFFDVLGLIGIPVDDQGYFMQKAGDPETTCRCGHHRLHFPTITRPGETEPGIVGPHNDDFRFGGRLVPGGFYTAPPDAFFFTEDEAHCYLDYLGWEPESECPYECQEDPPGDCEPYPYCDPEGPPWDGNTCAQQTLYRMLRHLRLKGWEYLTQCWVDMYYMCGPAETEAYMRSMEGDGNEYAEPLLLDDERAAFLADLEGIAQNHFGGDHEAVLAYIDSYTGTRSYADYWTDCNANGIPDYEDIHDCGTGVLWCGDCDHNGMPDQCDDTSADCNGNTFWDACDIAYGTSVDCDDDRTPDECQIPVGSGGLCTEDCDPDCNENGIVDSCEWDCNDNGVPDDCDLTGGTSADCNTNDNPDECDTAVVVSLDENFHRSYWKTWTRNGFASNTECRSEQGGCADGISVYVGDNLTCTYEDNALCELISPAIRLGYGPTQLTFCSRLETEVDADFARVLVNDETVIWERSGGTGLWEYTSAPLTSYQGETITLTFRFTSDSQNSDFFGWEVDNIHVESQGMPDCNGNSIPDECMELELDCNDNDVPDMCDIRMEDGGTCFMPPCSTDCQGNEIPDECDIAAGTSVDCNGNNMPDDCDIAGGTSEDCNDNDVPDECDVAGGTSLDCNGNVVPDECEWDCNENDVPDDCDLAGGTSEDCNNNDVPDECDIAEMFYDASPQLSPLDWDNPQSYDVPGPLEPLTDVHFMFTASAFLWHTPMMYVSVLINGTHVGDVFVDTGGYCSYPADVDALVVDAGTFNATVQGGDLHIEMQPSGFVTPGQCEDSYITVAVESGSADQNDNDVPDECELDCNGNGVPDAYDIAEGTSQDADGNRVPDECDEAPLPEDSLGVTCFWDSECDYEARCVRGVCYVPKHRYISVARSAGQWIDRARRVKLDDGTVLGWVGTPDYEPPNLQHSGLWFAEVVSAPVYVEPWPDVVHVTGCEIATAQTYLVQAIRTGQDIQDEGNYSAAVPLHTPFTWGDTVSICPNNECRPPEGVVGIDDITAGIKMFQGIHVAPLPWLDIAPSYGCDNPDRIVGLSDIMGCIAGFQGEAYPGFGPTDCDGCP